MQLFSSPSSSSSSSPSTSSASKPRFPFPRRSPKHPPTTRIIPIKSLQSPPSHLTLPPYTSANGPSPVIQKPDQIASRRENLEGLLVPRPVIQSDGHDDDDDKEEEEGSDGGDEERVKREKSSFDVSLEKLAKKLPMFEPGRGEEEGEVKEQPLKINLDLALYRAKILAQKFQFQEAEKLLQQCIYYWPEDGRPYVALGKVLRKQSRVSEARSVYEEGSQATQGENAFIWQCWAVLESEMGNVRRARELFDAATVADKRHIGAWHAWAVLELKQGNFKKARNLLGKAIKYCGGNEYVYQTLALLEAKADRYEQAQYLFRQATRCNPNSCASWLVSSMLSAFSSDGK